MRLHLHSGTTCTCLMSSSHINMPSELIIAARRRRPRLRLWLPVRCQWENLEQCGSGSQYRKMKWHKMKWLCRAPVRRPLYGPDEIGFIEFENISYTDSVQRDSGSAHLLLCTTRSFFCFLFFSSLSCVLLAFIVRCCECVRAQWLDWIWLFFICWMISFGWILGWIKLKLPGLAGWLSRCFLFIAASFSFLSYTINIIPTILLHEFSIHKSNLQINSNDNTQTVLCLSYLYVHCIGARGRPANGTSQLHSNVIIRC